MKFLRVGILFQTAVLAVSIAGMRELHAQPAQPGVTRTVVGGAGGWDYLTMDAARHRLFVTRGDRVDVFDVDSMRLTGSIARTDGVHGVALSASGDVGYASNGRTASVTVFDPATLRAISDIKGTGSNPDAVLVDDASGRVFTFNGRSHDATVIDAASRRVVATIALPGKPGFAVADDQGGVFVNIEDRISMVRIDALNAKVTDIWPLAGCDGPGGLAMDRVHHRLFAACGNRVLLVVDALTGKTVASVQIGAGSDAVAFDPGLGLVMSSNGGGTLSVSRQIDADHYATPIEVPTARGARTMAIDATTHRVYLVTADIETPAPTTASSGAAQRPAYVLGTFSILTVELSQFAR